MTRSGNATSSNALVNRSFGTAPITSDVMLMNPGDELAIAMSDTPSGFHVSITDFTTGQQGTMTANTAHGFEQEVFDPSAGSCTTQPYTFHPMFATSSEDTRVWTAHTYNVAFSMEIGHQTQDGYAGGSDGDTTFMGPSYVHDWAGSLPPATDSTVNASSIAFPSPMFLPTHGHSSGQYDRVAFEADMPVFEFDDQACVTKTGVNCTNPPQGAAFYPIYSTSKAGLLNLSCVWHFGDTQIANTNNLFGGDSAAEYGALLDTFFPGLGFRFENYHNTLGNNPCKYVSLTVPKLPFPLPIPPNVRTRPQPIPPEELIGIEMIIAEEITLRSEGLSEGQVLRVGEVLESIDQTILGIGTGTSGGGGS